MQVGDGGGVFQLQADTPGCPVVEVLLVLWFRCQSR